MHSFNIPPKCRDWPLKKIAKKFGCSIPTASKYRQQLGNVRRKIDWLSVDWEKHSTSELASMFGCRKGQVSRKRAELAPETLAKFKPRK